MIRMSTDPDSSTPSPQEYEIVARAMRDLLGGEFYQLAAEMGVDLNEMAHFTPLSEALKQARLRKGATFKAMAAQLKTTQRALKDIEEGLPGDVQGEVLARYAEALGERALLEDWISKNTAFAFRLGVPGVEAPAPFIVPDMAPGAHPPRLLGEDESLDDSSINKKAAELRATVENLSAASFAELLEEPAAGKRKPASAPAIWRMKVTLLHLDPPIWRRFTVPNTMTLGDLHEVLQVVMGWTNSHLHAFKIGKVRYEHPYPGTDFDEYDPAPLDERKFKLADLGLRAKSQCEYEYDFGDGWQHLVVLEKVLPFVPGAVPVCEAGEHACPPEDCGGPFNYPDMLDAARDPKNPDHEQWAEWLGDFDPFHFPQADINSDLTRLGGQRGRKRRR